MVMFAGVVILSGATLATMSWSEPPRFDGAGYATLGKALAEGRGYREINRPDAPPHAHFPPGYPAVLALIWKTVGTEEVGRFTTLSHAASLIGMAVGLWSVGRWWSRIEPRGVATCLTLALAVNWTWVRTGGVIRSEPLAIALGGLSLLLARRSSGRPGPPVGLALLLGLGILTRQVFACWTLAVAVDLLIRRRRFAACVVLAGAAVAVAPWVYWQIRVGSGSQSRLFRGEGLLNLIAGQALFYARRIPDAMIGPFIEVATVFGRDRWLGGLGHGGWDRRDIGHCARLGSFGPVPSPKVGRVDPAGHDPALARLAVHRGGAIPDPARPVRLDGGGRRGRDSVPAFRGGSVEALGGSAGACRLDPLLGLRGRLEPGRSRAEDPARFRRRLRLGSSATDPGRAGHGTTSRRRRLVVEAVSGRDSRGRFVPNRRDHSPKPGGFPRRGSRPIRPKPRQPAPRVRERREVGPRSLDEWVHLGLSGRSMNQSQ